LSDFAIFQHQNGEKITLRKKKKVENAWARAWRFREEGGWAPYTLPFAILGWVVSYFDAEIK